MLRAALLLCVFQLTDPSPPAPLRSALVNDAQGLDTPSPPTPITCVTYQGRVRYSLGYDHLVDVKNGCTQSVSCAVSTNVNPEPITVNLKPEEATTVVTFIGSPAREFQPQVTCKYTP